MGRALREAAQMQGHLKARHVHDLRVALRRCRSVAAGLRQLDPNPAWAKMRRAAKRLLGGMSDLRDIQVMRDWISKLGMSKNEAGLRMSGLLAEREHRARRDARKALKAFDTKQWRKWTRQLPERARRISPVTPAFELIALERWREAWELHRAAIQLQSRISFHRLRVGIKRFRYSVESFMPAQAAAWGRELKGVQDLLGEVHDLDVLSGALQQLRPPLSGAGRRKWRKAIESGRSSRLAAYREKMTGRTSLWNKWRAALPEERTNPPARARRAK